MTDVTHRRVKTNGIELHVAEAGPQDGSLVVLCHGFPELWYSWRHQIPALAGAGYRVIAPDLRGYGDSDRPAEVADYGIRPLTDDLLGLVDEAGRDQATFVGHDWGALIVWEMARLHPERCQAVCAMSVPIFTPPLPPTQLFEALFPDRFFYMLYFQEVGPAETELGRDPRATMRRILWAASGGAATPEGLTSTLPRQGTGFLDTMPEAPSPLPDWLTEDDVETYGAAFEKSGFFGPVSFYRNLDANWELTHDIPLSTIAMPTAFIAGAKDAVIAMNPGGVTFMEQNLPDFRGATLIDGAGHWNQQERPQETNDALLAFLDKAVGRG